MSEIPRKYDPEFKAGAVRIVRETRRPVAEIARELGIDAGTLGNWVPGRPTGYAPMSGRPQHIGRASILIRLSGPRTKGNRADCPLPTPRQPDTRRDSPGDHASSRRKPPTPERVPPVTDLRPNPIGVHPPPSTHNRRAAGAN